MRRNLGSQVVASQAVSATDGSAFTGAVTVFVSGDGGTQAQGTTGSGVCVHEGNGLHSYVPSQAETNFDHVAFTFIGTGAVPVTVQIYTLPTTGILAPTTAGRTLDVSVDGEAGIDWANIGSPTTAQAFTNTAIGASIQVNGFAANAITAAAFQTDAIDANALAADAVAEIQSGLATAAALTAVDTVVDSILADTNELQTDWADGGRLDLILDARASQSSVNTVDGIVDDILLDTSEIGLAGAGLTNINLPNQTMDIVGNITGSLSGSVGSVTGAVGSVIDKTGFKLASDGLDQIVPAAPSSVPAFGVATIVQWLAYFGLWSTAKVTQTDDTTTLRNVTDTADVATHAVSDDGDTFVSDEAT